MRFSGKTDAEDWHWKTLVWMARRREFWDCGVTWKEWGFGFDYTWYDGPIFQLRAGPFWIGLIYP